MRILRAFLGATFLYAGVQKFMDPAFLQPGSPDFIGTQLAGFADRTPMAPLLAVLGRVPVLTGFTIALVEVAVGVGTLLGIAATTAAIVGATISVSLWLSATWHVHPYFLGSDSIYAVAWVALVAGVWESQAPRVGARSSGPIERIDGIGRRELLRGGLVAGASGLIAIMAIAFRSLMPPRSENLAFTSPSARFGSSSDGGGRRSQPAPSTSAPPSVRGRSITSFDRLNVMEPIGFTGPDGVPAVLIRLPDDKVLAYSRVCTHAGCTVGYDSGAQLLVCPCHGAEFDPARGAEPVAGPTSTPLEAITVAVDPSSGDVVLPT